MHGWGSECLDAKLIECSWTLTLFDLNGRQTSLTFDLVQGRSPLILGLDVKEFSNTLNLKENPYIEFKRPFDTATRMFRTYISPDSQGCKRIRIEIVPHVASSSTSLMTSPGNKRSPLTIAKRLHRYTHATADEMKNLYDNAGILSRELSAAFDRVYQACDICASSGRPHHSKKLSIAHIDKAFNDEVQADFLWCTIQGTQFVVLNIVDTSTKYGERVQAPSRSAKTMMELVESHWICRHGAPSSFSADVEFTTTVTKQFMSRHSVEVHARPVRAHNKTGIVERNNGLFKNIIKRLERERTAASPAELIARASFLTNVFAGSKLLSAFQLARGYSPSILGIPRSIVSQELLDAYREQVSIRAIQRMLKARNPETAPVRELKPGTKVWVYFNTSKQNEPTRWVSATVVEAQKNLVLCRRSNRGPPMSVAYEHIRIAPSDPLTAELMSCTLEEELEQEFDVGTSPSPTPDDPPPSPRTSPAPGGNMLDITNVTEENTGPGNQLVTGQKEESAKQGPLRLRLSLHDAKPPSKKVKFKPTMIAATAIGCPEKDIGSVFVDGNEARGDLHSNLQEVLKQVHDVVGSREVTMKKLEFAPSWLVESAFNSEYDTNWHDAYLPIDESDAPDDANVITSHVIYKVKTDENDQRKLKARIVPHGNKDLEKDDIRSDSSTAQFAVIRLLLFLTVFLGFRLGTVDVKGAYLQSGPITRDIYVRPPREWKGPRGILWKLVKLPYGIVEAGRQWQKAIENWMLNEAGFERVLGVSQLFRKRDLKGNTVLLVAKVTDDFLMSGTISAMNEFVDSIQSRFKISKAIIDSTIKFNGCVISQASNGDVSMSMQDYLVSINPISISRMRRKQGHELATTNEIRAYKRLAGELVWLGGSALPQASFMASFLQQKVGFLKVAHLCEANGILQDLKSLVAVIKFQIPAWDTHSVCVCTFSDASFNIAKSQLYGQSGVVTGVCAEVEKGESLYYMIDWTSSKQRRVSHSSYGAEILACADADDRGFHLKKCLQSFAPTTPLKHVLHVDSRALYDTITTLHEGKEYRLRQTVERIRNSFESKELDVLRWIPGNINIADALTKRNIAMHRLLNKVAVDGSLCIDVDNGYELDSETWV